MWDAGIVSARHACWHCEHVTCLLALWQHIMIFHNGMIVNEKRHKKNNEFEGLVKKEHTMEA